MTERYDDAAAGELVRRAHEMDDTPVGFDIATGLADVLRRARPPVGPDDADATGVAHEQRSDETRQTSLERPAENVPAGPPGAPGGLCGQMPADTSGRSGEARPDQDPAPGLFAADTAAAAVNHRRDEGATARRMPPVGGGMRVQFHRGDRPGAYAVLVRRIGGVTVRLPGYDSGLRVPHVLAHFVTEREFRLAYGIFGCIAAGAMFSNMTLVDGRPRYDAQVRSRAVLRAHAAELALAEGLSGAVHTAVEQNLALATAHRRLREAWEVLRAERCPYEPADLNQVLDALNQLARQWQALEPGETLALRWVPPLTIPNAEPEPQLPDRVGNRYAGRLAPLPFDEA